MATFPSVASMTGFARQDGGDGSFAWSWEVKSVNGRSLDVRCRLPSGWEGFDPIVRNAVQARFARGNLQVTLTVSRAQSATSVQVNRELLDRLLLIIRELGKESALGPARLDGVLSMPGVISLVEEEEGEGARANREAAMQRDLSAALEALVATRLTEGARLRELAIDRLDEIARELEAATSSAAAQPEFLRTRLQRQVEELLGTVQGLPEERLAQEVAILVTKADVREELDRVAAHLAAAHELLDKGGPVGRRLDFLCQEFNREANTLCSKSADVELTQIGIELKATVEQLREQVQNIE